MVWYCVVMIVVVKNVDWVVCCVGFNWVICCDIVYFFYCFWMVLFSVLIKMGFLMFGGKLMSCINFEMVFYEVEVILMVCKLVNRVGFELFCKVLISLFILFNLFCYNNESVGKLLLIFRNFLFMLLRVWIMVLVMVVVCVFLLVSVCNWVSLFKFCCIFFVFDIVLYVL